MLMFQTYTASEDNVIRLLGKATVWELIQQYQMRQLYTHRLHSYHFSATIKTIIIFTV
jgi:hypothetical protein